MIREFKAEDFFRLDVQDNQIMEKSAWLSTMAYNNTGPKSFTYERDHKVIAIGGIEERLCKPELWVLLSRHCNRIDLRKLTRFANLLLDGRKDVRVTTMTTFKNAERWVEILGFRLQGFRLINDIVISEYRR